jgi:hypothetical protein
MLGIPSSMNDKQRQVTTGLHASQWSEAARQPTVHGDHASDAIGIAETKAVRHRGSISAADKEDPFRVDMKQAAGLPDCCEDAILETVKVVWLRIEEGAADDLRLGTSRP